MRVLLTGGTGYIGSAILSALIDAGHNVVATVRSEEAGRMVAAAGALPRRGDVADQIWLAEQLERVDGAVHAASPNDTTSAEFDRGVAEAVIAAFSGTAKPYLHTSGLWIWGSGLGIDEHDRLDPPRITRWRTSIDERVLSADIAATIPAPGTVHGNGRGLTRLLSRRGADGRVRLIGDGGQHWSTIHVDDLADLYVALLERDQPAGYVIAVSGETPTVHDIALAASRRVGVIAESPEESRTRLGRSLADALMLDQVALGRKARSLGWMPRRVPLLEDLRAQSK